jgi:RNA polymerase sigma-70 factor (ECF subfamily)
VGLTADTRECRRPREREYVRLVELHRDELRAHSRRILRSAEDAEDALQEALLRAWRALPRFEGRSSLRTWLYRIVTNTSLDAIHRGPRRVVPIDLDETTPADHWHAPATEPAIEGRYLTREAFERALIVSMRLLPARQRAVLMLREVLGFSARETADALDTTVASVNSALQRARATIETRLPERDQQETLRSLGDERLGEMVERYVNAWERNDVEAIVSMLAEDACPSTASSGIPLRAPATGSSSPMDSELSPGLY